MIGQSVMIAGSNAALKAALAPALVLGLACGGDGAPESAPPPTTAQPPDMLDAAELTDAEAAYLEELRDIDARIADRVQVVEEALSTAYPTRGRLFQVVGEQELHGTFQTMLAAAQAITPPDRFVDDHQAYVGSLQESIDLAEQLEAAMEDEDIVRFALLTTELFLSRTHLLANASPVFCNESLSADIRPRCAPSEPLPGGDYGAQLNQAFRTFVAEFSPRVGSFLPAFSPDDRIAALLELQPPIIEALENVLDEAQALDPPDALRDDHDRIVQYIEETLDVSRAISAAAEAGDFDETEILFRRSAVVLCSAQNELSEDALALVPSWFNNPDC